MTENKKNEIEKRLKKIEAKTIERLKQDKEDCFVKKYLKAKLLEKQSKNKIES